MHVLRPKPDNVQLRGTMVSPADTVNAPKGLCQSGSSGLASAGGRGHSGDRGAWARARHGNRWRFDAPARFWTKGDGRTMKRLLGVPVACARRRSCSRSAPRVGRKLGRARLSRGLPSRFRCDRRGRPVGPARAHRTRARAVQGEVHHRRRRRPAEGDAGDHPDQAQERRQSAVQPHQRAGFEFLFRLPQRSRPRRLGRRRRQRLRLGRLRDRAVRFDRSVLFERASHDLAHGRRPRRAAGARDDGGSAGDPRTRGHAGPRDGPGRARAIS